MIYTKRDSCLMCKSKDMSQLLKKTYQIPLGNFVVDSPTAPSHFMPYNVLECSSCGTVQTEYLGDLNLIYGNNFAGAYGSIRTSHNQLFSEFITENSNVLSILEVGAGNGALSDLILSRRQIPYTILDPSYCGKEENKTILNEYIDNVNLDPISCDTVVMSHVFEHFYKPTEIIEKITSKSTIQQIYISLPDFEAYLEDGTYHVLNSEHTFCTTSAFLKELFEFYGFRCSRNYVHQRHSIFFEFIRDPSIPSRIFPVNQGLKENVQHFFTRLLERIEAFEQADKTLPVYVWPCSMHTLFALSFGLSRDRIQAVLDNSPLKIGKYLYGYGYPCLSFHEILEKETNKIILLAGGCYSKEIISIAYANPHNHLFIL